MTPAGCARVASFSGVLLGVLLLSFCLPATMAAGVAQEIAKAPTPSDSAFERPPREASAVTPPATERRAVESFLSAAAAATGERAQCMYLHQAAMAAVVPTSSQMEQSVATATLTPMRASDPAGDCRPAEASALTSGSIRILLSSDEFTGSELIDVETGSTGLGCGSLLRLLDRHVGGVALGGALLREAL